MISEYFNEVIFFKGVKKKYYSLKFFAIDIKLFFAENNTLIYYFLIY